MSYIVATSFNQDSWNAHGLKWLRNAKSNSLDGIIVGENLNEIATDKIAELGFIHAPLIQKFNVKGDIFYTLLQNIQKNQRCLWTIPSYMPKAGIKCESDLVCGVSKSTPEYLTSGVVNLHDRAAMIQSLQEKIYTKHNGFLSSEWILGTYDFWNGYVGCQTYLQARQYLDYNPTADDLVLNFFMAFANSLSCEVVTTKEAA